MNTYPQFYQKNFATESFSCNLHWANNLVRNAQTQQSKQEVPLTFYPIAKNIRTAASYMAKNVLENKQSFIQNMSRSGEESFWSNTLNRGNWYPWLWARGRSDGQTNIDGWKYYFNSFTDTKNTYETTNAIEPPENLKLFFVYLACIKFTFQLNEHYLQEMKEYACNMKWPESSEVLAVQIRRGETCTKDGSKTDRPFYHLDKYIQEIDEMLQHHAYEFIYISTDSNEEIDKIKELRPQWKLLFLPVDRTKFFRMDPNAPSPSNEFSGIAQDLEDSCRLYPEKIPFIVDSALADLYFISKCQGYISTISVSEFSRCGWYLQLAFQEKLTPYINMNEGILDMNQRDKLLLL